VVDPEEAMSYLDTESVFVKNKFGDNRDDAATVASSAIESVYTGAPPSYMSRKANELADKLYTEK
jgi:hypothetical protein